MPRSPILFIAIFFFGLSQIAFAQFDLNGPNAKQFVQGLEGHVVDPIDHDIDVMVPGNFQLSIESGVNPFSPISTLMSELPPTPGVIPTPWGGALDLGTFDPVTTITDVVVIGDGITFTGLSPLLDALWTTGAPDVQAGTPPRFEFNLSISESQFAEGQNVITRSFQSIVVDPTNGPFNLDNTEVTHANFRYGQKEVLKTGEDGFATMDFMPGVRFNFHGQSYTQVHVHANGFITFGLPSTLANGGGDNDHAAWINDRPSIAASLSDWSPEAYSPNDGVLYDERGSLLRIAWGDAEAQSIGGMSHRFDSDLNQFEVFLQLDTGTNPVEGAFAVNFVTLDPNTLIGFGRGLVGHTPGGGALAGGSFDVNLRAENQSSPADHAQIEEHDLGGLNTSNLGWDGLGSLHNYNDFTTHFDGALILFQAQAGTGTTGIHGYNSMSIGALPDDQAQALSETSIANEGFEQIFLHGSFYGFDPQGTGAGSVIFDPDGNAGGPYPVIVQAILDDSGVSGPLSFPNTQPALARNSQALVLVTPNFTLPAGGQVDIDVKFASGKTVRLSTNVRPQALFGITYFLNDDDFVAHSLNVPITLYGQTYNQIFVSSNGYVTLGSGSNINNGGQFSMNTGFGTFGNPCVAVMFTDLNPLGQFSGASYEVQENTLLNTVKVIFRNQAYWTTNETAGTGSVTFGDNGPNSFSLDLSQVFPAFADSANVTYGVSDGNVNNPLTNLSNGLGTGLFNLLTQGGGSGYVSPTPSDSIAEDYPRNLSLPFTQPIQFIDLATSAPFGLWSIQ
ncbi:MAG: hypothetical protein ACI97A_000747 [Planctomycetota bacterium]|jgi:hypothetical protein